MTLLYVLIIASVFLGGVLLWLSGWMAGLRGNGDSGDQAGPSPLMLDSMRREKEALSTDLRAVAAELEAAKVAVRAAEDGKNKVEEELARAVTEMTRVEGEMAGAEEEITRLAQENDALKKLSPDKPRPPAPPVPPPLPKGLGSGAAEPSDELDNAEARLDMERVAHQRTKDELESLKKLVKSVGSTGPAGMGLSGPRRDGSGFKTMSIDTRASSVSGTEHDRLRQSHDKLAREKERLEGELARAQQELQLLKMRQG